MAIIMQSPDSLSLSGNLKEYILSSGTVVTFTLKDGSTVLIDATYEPGADGRVTIDARDIIEARLKYTISHDKFYMQSGIVRTFTATIDGVETTFRAIRTGISNLSDTPTNWLSGNFLTWQPVNKQVTYYSPEWITYYATVASTMKLRAYFNDGTSQAITLGSMSAGTAYTANVQYSVVAGQLGHLYPQHYEVYVENLSGNRLTYIQCYYYSEVKSEQEQWFLFENSLGGLDTIRAYGDTDFTGDYEHKVAQSGDDSFEYDIDTNRKYSKNTGYINEYERRWLLDFFPSRAKYIYEGSTIRQITVTESDVKYTASDLPSSYTFIFIFSDALPYLNLIRNEEQIPENIIIPDIDSPDFSLPPRLSEYPHIQLHEGVILPAFDPHSDKPEVTTIGAILNAAAKDIIARVKAGEAGEFVDVLKLEDLREPSDFNVFSSLRTMLEIKNAKSEEYWTIDENGDLRTNRNVYSTQEITAFKKGPDGEVESGSLASLLDVDLTDLQNGQVLRFNGTHWVNEAWTGGGGGGSTVSWGTTLNGYSPLTVEGLAKTVALSGHAHAASDITSGILATARLGSGTPSASNFLRGDGTWATAGAIYSGSTSIILSGTSFQRAALTGDVTASQNSNVLTLANSGVTAGTYNNVATQVRPFTVDAKGRITNIGAAVTITAATLQTTRTLWGQPFNGSANVSGDMTSVGSINGSYYQINNTASNPYLRLASSSYTWYIQVSEATQKLYLGKDGNSGISITQTGLVGINRGTAMPTCALDVIGEIKSSLNVTSPKFSLTTGWTFEPSGSEMQFKYNGILKHRLLSDGSFVAVGEITAYGAASGGATGDLSVAGFLHSATQLSVGAKIGVYNPLRAEVSIISTSDNPAEIHFGQIASRSWTLSARGTGDGSLFGLYDQTNSAWRMVVLKSGNVGINNYAPTAKLDVVGDIKASLNITSPKLTLANGWTIEQDAQSFTIRKNGVVKYTINA